MGTVSKKFGFIRATLAMWTGNLFAGRAGVVTDSTPGPVERWGWWDGSAWKFSARSGANESFGSLTLSSYVVLNGATRPAWGSAFSGASQITDEIAIAPYVSVGPQAFQLWANLYYDTAYKAVKTYTGQGYPCTLAVFNGEIKFSSSQSNPTAGGVVSDLALRWSVNRFGGCGFFGVAAPTTRPTVNAACTDLATVIALTNQLRTHLIACGLVQ